MRNQTHFLTVEAIKHWHKLSGGLDSAPLTFTSMLSVVWKMGLSQTQISDTFKGNQ